MTSQHGKKLLQYTYCPISHEVSQPDNEAWWIKRI